MSRRYTMLVFLICLTLATLVGSVALAEPEQKYVLAGALGESFDALDEQEQTLCIQYAAGALEQLQQALSDSRLSGETAYGQVLQTILYRFERGVPTGFSEIEQKTWDDFYHDKECIVSFTVLEYYTDHVGKPLMECAARQRDYALSRDGTWEPFSLSRVRSRIFTSPVLPGMRTINMGSYCNSIHMIPGEDE